MVAVAASADVPGGVTGRGNSGEVEDAAPTARTHVLVNRQCLNNQAHNCASLSQCARSPARLRGGVTPGAGQTFQCTCDVRALRQAPLSSLTRATVSILRAQHVASFLLSATSSRGSGKNANARSQRVVVERILFPNRDASRHNTERVMAGVSSPAQPAGSDDAPGSPDGAPALSVRLVELDPADADNPVVVQINDRELVVPIVSLMVTADRAMRCVLDGDTSIVVPTFSWRAVGDAMVAAARPGDEAFAKLLDSFFRGKDGKTYHGAKRDFWHGKRFRLIGALQASGEAVKRDESKRVSPNNPLYLTALGVMSLVCDSDFKEAFPGQEVAFAQLFRAAAPFLPGDAEQQPKPPLRQRLRAVFAAAESDAERVSLAGLVTGKLMTGISDEDRKRVLRLGQPRRRGAGAAGAPSLETEHSRRALERVWAALEVSGRASPPLHLPPTSSAVRITRRARACRDARAATAAARAPPALLTPRALHSLPQAAKGDDSRNMTDMVGDLMAGLHPEVAAEIVLSRQGEDADELRQTIGEAQNADSYTVSTIERHPFSTYALFPEPRPAPRQLECLR